MTPNPGAGPRVIRWLRALGRELGRAIRGGAEPAGIGNLIAEDGDHTSDAAIGGAMIVGAGRRFGDAANEGTGPDGRQDPDF